jgi:hypothetical protein
MPVGNGIDPGNGVEPGGELDTPSAALRLAVAVAEFFCEIAMLVLLVIGGWGLGSGGLLGIALAVLYPAIALLIWAVWLAPRSDDRLDDPWRLIVQVALFAATGAVVALAGHVTTGVLFALIAVAAFVAERWLPA